MGKKASIKIGSGFIGTLGRIPVSTEQLFREFIDNSTTSYDDHRSALDKVDDNKKCIVQITWTENEIVIVDNAYGMDEEAFLRALRVNARSDNYTENSRGQYGIGLKYAAASLGRWYSIESTQLGSPRLYKATIDIDYLEKNNPDELDYEDLDVMDSKHGTKITIRNLQRKLNVGNNVKTSKVVDKLATLVERLSQIYSRDLRDGNILISINGVNLKYTMPDILQKSDGTEYFKQFEGGFDFDNKRYDYSGWIGILKTASTSNAGLALLQKKRAIQLNYRPEELFGKSNSYRFQRVIGEIYLEGKDWIVTFTKDAIKWDDNGLEEKFIQNIKNNSEVMEIFDAAEKYRKHDEEVDPAKINKWNLGKDFGGLKGASEKVFVTTSKTNKSEGENVSQTPPAYTTGNDNLKPKSAPTSTYISTSEEEKSLIPVDFENIHYEFEIVTEDKSDLSDNWIRVAEKDYENKKYYLYINTRVPFFKEFKKDESKKLIIKMGIALALAQLSSVSYGLKLSESQKLIDKLNEIIKLATK